MSLAISLCETVSRMESPQDKSRSRHSVHRFVRAFFHPQRAGDWIKLFGTLASAPVAGAVVSYYLGNLAQAPTAQPTPPEQPPPSQTRPRPDVSADPGSPHGPVSQVPSSSVRSVLDEPLRVEDLDATYLARGAVTVYDRPSTVFSSKLATWAPGAKIKVTGKVQGLPWYRVQLESRTGYVEGEGLSEHAIPDRNR